MADQNLTTDSHREASVATQLPRVDPGPLGSSAASQQSVSKGSGNIGLVQRLRGYLSASASWTLLGGVVYIGCAFILMSATWADPSRSLIGNSGDPFSYLWDLQWAHFALAHGMNPFFTNYIAAPYGANLAWTASIGPGILLLPVAALFGPVVTYNILATLSLALSAWLAQIAIRRFVPSQLGALVGGLFFGFSPYMTGHAWGHASITLAFLAPIALLLFHEIAVRQRWSPWTVGAIGGIAIVVEFVTFLETIAVVVTGVALAFLLVVLQRPKSVLARARYMFRSFAAMAVFVIAGVAFPLWTMLFGPDRLGHGTVEPPNAFVTDILNYLVPNWSTLWIPSFLHGASVNITNGEGVESGAYLGLPLLLVILIGVVWLRRNLVVRTAFLTGLTLTVLSLGPRLHVDGRSTSFPLPFAIFDRLPLFGNILAGRFSGTADLCFAIVIAAFAGELRRTAIPLRTAGAALVCFGLAVITPSFPLPSEAYQVPAYFTSSMVLRIPRGSTTLVLPYTTNGTQIASQVWQAASGFRFKMPEGYVYEPSPSGPITGPLPTPLGDALGTIGAGGVAPSLSDGVHASFLEQLRSWHVSTVILGPMPNGQAMETFLTQLLGRQGLQVGGVEVWYSVNGVIKGGRA